MSEENEKTTQFNKRNIQIVAAFSCAVICGTALNFLARRAALSEPPIALNGWRTLTASVILLLPVILLKVRMKLSNSELRWYVVLAALTMAIPHALIFFGLRKLAVTETTVAFVEAAVLGIVIVYLMASGKKVGKGAIACTVLTLFGLAAFLGVGTHGFAISRGTVCVIAAAIATAIGFIIAERVEPKADDKSFLGKCRRSTKKTFFACLFSGGGTLAVLTCVGIVHGSATSPVSIPASQSWPWIAILAIVGSCLSWFPVFLLLEFGELVLAAAVIAATPVTTEVANILWFTPTVNTWQQRLGGTLVLVALAILIWLQLGSRDKSKNGTKDSVGLASDNDTNGFAGPASDSNATTASAR